MFLILAVVPDQKILRLKILALEAGLLALIVAWAARAAAGSVEFFASGALDLPVLAYGLSGLAFYALSPEPRNSELELTRILFCCGSYFAAVQAASCRPRWLLRAWAASAGLAGLYAICQRLGVIGLAMSRPYSTFGNPIFLGCYLGASLPVCAMLLSESVGLDAVLVTLSIAAQATGLWLAQSRAGFAGLIAGSFVWALLRLSGHKRLRLLGSLALFGAGLLFNSRGRAWTHPLIWRDALALWRDHPWLGCGLGRFHLEFPAYASQATRALWPQNLAIVNFAHNEYLQVLAETGVAGLAFFLAVPARFVAALLRQTEPATGLADAPALAAAALFACALFSPDLRFGASAFLAFAALGLWAGRAQPKLLRVTPTLRAGLVSAAAAYALGFGWLAAAPALAQRRLSLQPAFEIQATAEVKAEIARLEAAAADPQNAGLAENIAYLYARAQAPEPAAHWFRKAADLAPTRPGPWNNLGNLAYLQGDADAAIANWKRSLSLKPDQLDAHLNLAKLYYERGKLKDAARHCEAALRLDSRNEKARLLLKKMVE